MNWLSGLLLGSLLSSCSLGPATRDVFLPPGEAVEPHLAVRRDGQLLAVWAVVARDGSADVAFAELDTESGRWKTARRVNPNLGTAVAGRQVGPRIAITPDGSIIAVAWVDRAEDPAGDVVLSVSNDGGRSFSPPRRVNDDGREEVGQEYHDLAVTPDGTICLVWLDERDAPPDYVNRKQVYFAASRDGGRTFSPNRRLTMSPRGVCPCCRPGLAVGSDGSLHAVYRDREDEELFVRMITRRAGAESFSPPTTLSKGWRFSGCPVNAPSVGTGPLGKVWALWVDGTQGGSTLWWARSDDGARSFPAVGQVDTSAGGLQLGATHIALASSRDSGAVATWRTVLGQLYAVPIPSFGDIITSTPVPLSEEGAVAASPTVQIHESSLRACWVEIDGRSLGSGLAPPSCAVFSRPNFCEDGAEDEKDPEGTGEDERASS